MQHALLHQLLDGGAVLERPGKTDERPAAQGGGPALFQAQQVAHLAVQVGVGQRVGGELVAQEVGDDLFGKADGVQGHDRCSCLE